MASNYPDSLDAFSDPTAANTLASPDHALLHQDINSAVENIQGFIGALTDTSDDYLGGAVRFTSFQTISTTSITNSGASFKNRIVFLDNSSAITFTIQPDSTVNPAVGTTYNLCQKGTGQITIAQGAGVTVNSSIGLKSRARWSVITITKMAANTWLAFGDLTT